LTLAGKVIVKSDSNRLASKYWHAKEEAMLKIPTLAIHLTDKSGIFEPNKESHLKPILASAIVD
jgi:aspartyl aminopeptidase